MTRAERGQQIWQVLAGCASNRQITTYSLVAERIGMGRGTLAQPLGCVAYYCKRNSLPPLTSLVVNKTGRPGSGLSNLVPVTDQAREEVFDYPWDKRLPPSAAELQEAYIEGSATQSERPR